MKIVILCGGKGTRLAEETKVKPKPMVKIGNLPIIVHIMEIFKKQGFDDFILALGYKGELIKKYFKNKNYKVKLVNTGKETLTGGRLLRLKKILKNEKFFLTYGDGVADIDLKKLLKFHNKHKKKATVTAVRPPARFGEIYIRNSKVNKFQEKPQTSSGWINGGFFIFEKEIFNYLKNSKTILEREPLEMLCKKGELMAFKSLKFWQCMDTLRDKELLNKIWNSKEVPWKIN
jgi:glucose-1-phosphate cytidylyltransferase